MYALVNKKTMKFTKCKCDLMMTTYSEVDNEQAVLTALKVGVSTVRHSMSRLC